MMVVAKYKESIDWCKNLECIIYDKSKKRGKNVLDNVGRESHTYLTYIVDNYENLPDYMIFTQANPFDHVPDFLDKLDINKPYYDFEIMTLPNRIEIDRLQRLGASIFTGEDFKLLNRIIQILGLKLTSFDANYYGIFGVQRERVLRYTKEQYKEVLDLHYQFEITPYIMEILWRQMYN